jgi:hypothetical protein
MNLFDRTCRNPECRTILRVSLREPACRARFCGGCLHAGRLHLRAPKPGQALEDAAYVCSDCGDEWTRGGDCGTPYGPISVGLDVETEKPDPGTVEPRKRRVQAVQEAAFPDAVTRTGTLAPLAELPPRKPPERTLRDVVGQPLDPKP